MSNREAIVVGGSAGSLEALSRFLPFLPAEFPLPVIVVIHLPPDKESVLAELLRDKCPMTVEEAQDKQPIEPGKIYFAPPDYHLLVEKGRYFSLSADEPYHFSRPSIDVLFESAADAYGDRLIGIILSGANDDGADGLRRIAAENGLGLVQDPDRAYASAMPLAALARCPTARALDPAEIAAFLKEEIVS